MLSNVAVVAMPGNRVIAQADRLCITLHFLAWLATLANWGISWWRYGPEPCGPLYYSALKFIGRLDILVYRNVEDLTIKVGQGLYDWFSVDLGASFMIAFACLILLAGSLQWFLLGRLVQWLAVRRGRKFALAVLGAYGAWAGLAVFLWVAS